MSPDDEKMRLPYSPYGFFGDLNYMPGSVELDATRMDDTEVVKTMVPTWSLHSGPTSTVTTVWSSALDSTSTRATNVSDAKDTSDASSQVVIGFVDAASSFESARFRCASKDCSMTYGYRRIAELQRHYHNYHSTPGLKLWCPVTDCPRSFKDGHQPFPRKDKLMAHLRNIHDGGTSEVSDKPTRKYLEAPSNSPFPSWTAQEDSKAQAQHLTNSIETSHQAETRNSCDNVCPMDMNAMMPPQDESMDCMQTEPSDPELRYSSGCTTCSEEESLSPRSHEEEPLLDIELQRDQILDRLMLRVHEMFTPGALTFRGCAISETRGKSKGEAPRPSLSTGAKRKRMLHDRSNGHESDKEDDINKGQKLRTNTEGVVEPSSKKLACPFFKHNPSRHHSSRACRGPGWDTTHRIKGHLYRVHAMPLHCRRCYAVFDHEDSCTEHARSTESCVITDASPPEGFNKDQEAKLKDRKSMFQAETEEEKWKIVYLILFPDTVLGRLPSPYYDTTEDSSCEQKDDISPPSAEVSQFDAYLRRELPRKIRKKLQCVLEGRIGPIEETLKNELEVIVRDCQESLTRSFFDTTNIPPRPSISAQPDAISMPTQQRLECSEGEVPPERQPRPSIDDLSQFSVPADAVPMPWPDVGNSNHTQATSLDSTYFSMDNMMLSGDTWLDSFTDSNAFGDTTESRDPNATEAFIESQFTPVDEPSPPTYTGKGKGRADFATFGA